MNDLKKLDKDQINMLKSVGVIAENWFAVSYNETQKPLAIFSNEEYATEWRDRCIATAIVEPWPMVIKDYRKQKSNKQYEDAYKDGWNDAIKFIDSPTE